MNGLAYMSRLRGVEIDLRLVKNLRSAVLVLRSARAASDRAASDTRDGSDAEAQGAAGGVGCCRASGAGDSCACARSCGAGACDGNERTA